MLAACTSFSFTASAYNCNFEWEMPECDDGNPVNGYFWHDFEVWVPGYITVETWFTQAPKHFTGKATYYGPGAMEATATWRGLSLDGFLDGVALMSPADIGKTVWIRFNGRWEGPFLVVDCARRGDMWPVIMHRDEAVEVGYETATRWGLEPPYPEVEVAKELPRGSTPIVLSEWFEKLATFGKLGPRIYFRSPCEWYINNEWVSFNDSLHIPSRRNNNSLPH